MYRAGGLLAIAAAVGAANAYTGFNYGATFTDGRVKTQSDYVAEFNAAAGLDGTDGMFTSARLYTMIQGGTPNEPIEAIQAAIDTGTSLLLGLWASAGETAFNNELDALNKAVQRYGDSDLDIAGISVGSEDLYRISPTGIANDEFAGAQPDQLVDYIGMVRDVLSGTPWEGVPIGHVDTWTAFVNGSNAAVIDACDFLGMDAYAYFESTKANEIANGKQLFDEALSATQAMSRGKPVWITETGWPVSGKTVGAGVPSLENARKFWVDVGCELFGETNVWWYTFQDSAPNTPNPSFGVIGSDLTTEPLYDLSCPAGGDDGGDEPTTTTTRTSTTDTETTTDKPTTTTGGDGDDSGDDTDSTTPSSPTSTPDDTDDETTTFSTGTRPTTPSTTTTEEPSETSDESSSATSSGPGTVPTGAAGQLDSGLAAAAAVFVAAMAL